MKRILWSLLILVTLVAGGCGYNNSVNGASDSTTPVVPPVTTIGPPAAIALKVMTTGGALRVQATVTDSSGKNVADGTVVSFTMAPVGTITSSATTTSGIAMVPFTPGGAGSTTITAMAANGIRSSVDYIAGGPATAMTLVNSVVAGTFLSQGGKATITATVLDSNGNPVGDGATVTFSASTGSISASASTASGKAVATYTAGATSGAVTVTATTNGIIRTTSFTVGADSAASIITESVVPAVIGAAGSGIVDTALITFMCRDSGGNPISDQTPIEFSIVTPLGGNEFLTSTSTTTAGGKAVVTLKSGTVPGIVSVSAKVTGINISTVAQVTIVSNRPDAGRLTLAAETLNLAGGVTLGLQSVIHAYLGDRSGNVVPDGTPVSFISECGTIGNSNGFETTTTYGVASATFQTSSPSVPELGGIAPKGNVGLCRIVGYTPGQGTYIDANGNGKYDAGDTCTSATPSAPYMNDEPFIDANDSGVWEAGEYYVDVNKNGKFDANVVDCVSKDTMIWSSMNLLISSWTAPVNLTPNTFNLGIGESKSFVFDLMDEYDNALVAGTNVTITTDGGKLAGVTTFTMPDTNGTGGQLNFALFSDTAANATPKAVTVTATITPPAKANNNGASTFDVAFGMINLPAADVPRASLFITDPIGFGPALAQGATTTITAFCRDSDGVLVPDGTKVTFTVSAGIIGASANTVNGEATVNFTAPNSGGPVTITAYTSQASNTHTITIANGDAATINLDSVQPGQIGVRGSGLADSSTIRFVVMDEKGAPVTDGTPVTFALKTPLGGGERISVTSANTVDGKVSVILQSGTRSGTAAITASINAGGTIISTVARVVIASGLPDEKHFSLSASKLNLPGYTYFGQTTEIRAYLADRYSNPVPVGTPIFFESEAGAMALTQAETSALGQATATHISQAPLPNTISAVTGLPGLSKILAWTAGQESFVDYNGNGLYDAGEPFGDIGEPFIDADDDGVWDASGLIANEERYVDINGNGVYDGPNGVWNGDTFIWTTMNILWSHANPSFISLTVTPAASCPGFVINNGTGCDITIEVKDSNGSPIVGGSGLSVATSVSSGSFTISPNTFTVPDATIPGTDTTKFVFSISNSQIGLTDLAYPLTVTLNVPALANSPATTKTKTITFTLKP